MAWLILQHLRTMALTLFMLIFLAELSTPAKLVYLWPLRQHFYIVSSAFWNPVLHLLFLLTCQHLSHPCWSLSTPSRLVYSNASPLSIPAFYTYCLVWLVQHFLLSCLSLSSWHPKVSKLGWSLESFASGFLTWYKVFKLLEDSFHIICYQALNVWPPCRVFFALDAIKCALITWFFRSLLSSLSCWSPVSSAELSKAQGHCVTSYSLISLSYSLHHLPLTSVPLHSPPEPIHTAVLVSRPFCHLLLYFEMITLNIFFLFFSSLILRLCFLFVCFCFCFLVGR